MRESVSSWTATIGNEKEGKAEETRRGALIGPRPPDLGPPIIGPTMGPAIGPVQVVHDDIMTS